MRMLYTAPNVSKCVCACLSSKVTKTSLPRLSALNKVFQRNKESVPGIKAVRKKAYLLIVAPRRDFG
jgi:hypothetical protein